MLSFGPARMYPYYCELKTGKTIRQERKLGWSLGINMQQNSSSKIAKNIYKLTTDQISAGDFLNDPGLQGKSFEHSTWSHTVPWQLVERRRMGDGEGYLYISYIWYIYICSMLKHLKPTLGGDDSWCWLCNRSEEGRAPGRNCGTGQELRGNYGLIHHDPPAGQSWAAKIW